MASLVCKRFAKGPKCSDPRLETTDAEQADCFTRARIACTGQLMTCLSELYVENQCHDSENKEARIPDCIDFHSCINEDCREALMQCFCTGLAGLTCVVCPDETTEETPDDTTDIPGETNTQLKDASLTVSSYNTVIPIINGRVVVGGNVIWVGNAKQETITTSSTVGNKTDVTVQTYGFVDLAIGLCAGEIEAIGRIWVADTLVVDNRIEYTEEEHPILNSAYYDLGFNAELHKGAEAEKMFVNMASAEGFGRTPAHRGLAVLMLRNFPVVAAGTAFPSIQVEVLSRVDRSIPSFGALESESISDDVLSVDYVSNRAFVGSGDDIKVIDIDGMTVVNTIAVASPVHLSSLYATPEGDIIFRFGSTLRHVYGYNYADFLDYAMSSGYVAELVAHEKATERPVSAVIVADGRDVSLLETDFYNREFTLLATKSSVLPNVGAEFKQIVVADYNNPLNPNVNKVAVMFAQDGGNIVISRLQLESRSDNFGFSADRDPINYTFFGSFLGTQGSTLSHVDAFEDTRGSSIILQMQDADDVHHFTQYIVEPFDLGWTTVLPEGPTNTGSKLKFRQGVSRDYLYITPSGNIYRLALDTGIVTLISNLNDYSAPMITGPQYYDAAKGFILYVADGALIKLYPERYAGAEATVADVIYRTLTAVGVDAAYIDVSAVTSIKMSGYLISSQQNAQAVLQDLMNFFHLSGADNGGKLTFRPRSVVSNVTVNDDDKTKVVATRVEPNIDNVFSVSVKYYDTDREGGVFTQIVSRDFMEDYVDFVSNEQAKEYSAEVFTNADTARLSAERTLLRELQRRDKLEFTAAMRALLIEPFDNIDGYRANTIEIDSTLITKVTATTEADDVYDFTPALDGVTIARTNPRQVDYDAPVRNHLVGFALPPLFDAPANDVLYVAESQPDLSPPYSATEVFTRGPNGTFKSAGTPSLEARVGRLVSAPTITDRRVFTPIDEAEVVIEFIDNISPSDITSLDDYSELFNSYTLNALFVGKEVMQYRTATIGVDNKTVTFKGLFRGRFGTDEFINSHVVGEVCAIYDPDRIVYGALGWDAGNYGIAIASTFDTRDTTRRRDIEVPFTSQLTRKWPMGHVQMKKKQTGSSRGLYFKMFPRMRFINTFTDDGDYEVFNGNGRLAMCVLSAPYDEATLLTELEDTSRFPIDFVQLDPHDSTYIKHFFTGIDEPSVLLDGFVYPQAQMIDDGVSYSDTIHIAVFNYVSGEIDSAVLGVSFYGDYPYLDFEGGVIIDG